MRTLIALTAAVILASCGQQTAPAQSDASVAQVQTVTSVTTTSPVYQPPPVLQSESMTLRLSQTEKAAGRELQELTPEDEKLRSSLPFTPAIALDPVDGNKISIRANTPRFEYKGRVYYFATEAHRAAFMGNPEQYAKGPFNAL